MDIYVKLRAYDNENVCVCPHISFKGREITENESDDSEYETDLVIKCATCDKTYVFVVAIN